MKEAAKISGGSYNNLRSIKVFKVALQFEAFQSSRFFKKKKKIVLNPIFGYLGCVNNEAILWSDSNVPCDSREKREGEELVASLTDNKVLVILERKEKAKTKTRKPSMHFPNWETEINLLLVR